MSDSRKKKNIKAEAGTGKARIFIVEDEVVIVRGLEDALQRFGYSVCGFAFSGEEALEGIEKARPELVLIDLFLKGAMDGIELAEIVSSRFGIPPIYITAYSNRDVLERARLTDPYGYIVKPFRDSQLKVTVELALERRNKEQERKSLFDAYRKTIQELESRISGQTRELQETRKELESTAKTAAFRKLKLDELRQELQEVNTSLLVLASQMTRTREELELEVAAAVRAKVLPILRQLQGDSHFQKYQTDFEMLSLHMGCLASSLARDCAQCGALSGMELRIATLVKNDFTSEQIASQLHLSLDTIKTHRRNIRKKLGIHNTPMNLSTYLKSQWTENHVSLH